MTHAGNGWTVGLTSLMRRVRAFRTVSDENYYVAKLVSQSLMPRLLLGSVATYFCPSCVYDWSTQSCTLTLRCGDGDGGSGGGNL